jgi:hypothetical protein
MAFEIGKAYRHNAGMTMRVLGELDTHIYGRTKIAERDIGDFVPVGDHAGADDNWTEITEGEYRSGQRGGRPRAALHEVPLPHHPDDDGSSPVLGAVHSQVVDEPDIPQMRGQGHLGEVRSKVVDDGMPEEGES